MRTNDTNSHHLQDNSHIEGWLFNTFENYLGSLQRAAWYLLLQRARQCNLQGYNINRFAASVVNISLRLDTTTCIISSIHTNMSGIMADIDTSYPSNGDQRLRSVIGPLLLLLILYYGFSYLAYETAIKRSVYETLARLLPTQAERLINQAFLRTQRILSISANDVEDTLAKSGDRSITYSGQGIPSVVQGARKLSGLDKLVPPMTEYTFPGLGNWDNSCFQNSILQGLASLPAFYVSVEESRNFCLANAVAAPALEGLHKFLGQLQEVVRGRQTIWPPSVLRSMNTWQQQDAQEYFSKILDAVEKEMSAACKAVARRSDPGLGSLRQDSGNRLRVAKDNSKARVGDGSDTTTGWLPHNSLEGFLSQKLRCQKCGFSEGVSFTSFNCLTLSLGIGGHCRLEALLDAYFEAELIDGVECDECTMLANQTSASKFTVDDQIEQEKPTDATTIPEKRPKVLSTKAKHILFGRLPRNLAIHINRSIFDNWGNQRKNNSLVEFPARLKIWGDWVEVLGSEDLDVHAIYELRCIINHSGRHDNGHYVACGKRGKEWFSFNDEIVIRTTEMDVLARGNVFMLFYEKLDDDPILEMSTPKTDSSRAGSPILQENSAPSEPECAQADGLTTNTSLTR